MPKLNNDIVLEIIEKTIKDNSNETNKLQMEMFKFGLIGKQNLLVLMQFFEKAVECNIDKDCFIAKIRKSSLIIGPCASIYLLSLMKKIGQSIKSLTIQDEPGCTKPIIDAICEAKRLEKLDLEDLAGASSFQRIIKECSKSLKKVTICLNKDIPHIGDVDGLCLNELLIETDLNNNLNNFLNQKCCRTKSLVFDLYQFLQTSSFTWEHLIQSFSRIQNRTLESVKEFKLLLEIDEYAEEIRLSEFIKNVAETFPNLELLNIEKQIPTQLQNRYNALDYYNLLYGQFNSFLHNFKANILWTVSQRCQQGSLQASKQNIISQSPEFTVTKEDDVHITLLCCNQISELKELTFKVHIVANSSSLNSNEETLLAEMNNFDFVD
uniref:Uncharacterized protein n=1 Tax=Panagrolaimus sp. PS1159 TaxID=55785 RepID=A0AC35FUR5_9BILA